MRKIGWCLWSLSSFRVTPETCNVIYQFYLNKSYIIQICPYSCNFDRWNLDLNIIFICIFFTSSEEHLFISYSYFYFLLCKQIVHILCIFFFLHVIGLFSNKILRAACILVMLVLQISRKWHTFCPVFLPSFLLPSLPSFLMIFFFFLLFRSYIV